MKLRLRKLCCGMMLFFAALRVCAQTADENRACTEDERKYFTSLYKFAGNKDPRDQSFVEALHLGHECSILLPIEDDTIKHKLTARRKTNKCIDYGSVKIFASTLEEMVGLKGPASVKEPNSRKDSGMWWDAAGRIVVHLDGDARGRDHAWASAFLVDKGHNGDDDLIMTSCHAIRPFLLPPDEAQGIKTWRIDPKYAQELYVNYSDRTDYYGHDYEVDGLVGYSHSATGLDVVLLEVKHRQGAPKPLSLFDGEVSSKCKTKAAGPNEDGRRVCAAAVVGFADFLHPVDPLIDESYGKFKTSGTAKFLSIGRIGAAHDQTEATSCRKDSGFIRYDASTTAGQSGAMLVGYTQGTYEPFAIIGVHACCTAYWKTEYAQPPGDTYNDPPCGPMLREYSNKAVSSWAILHDPGLCEALNQKGVMVIGADGNNHRVSCSGLKPLQK